MRQPTNDQPVTGPNPHLVDDDLLVERTRTDPEAFGMLYQRYCGPIFRMCLRAVGDADQADDLTAMVFLRAFERLERYQQQPNGSFRSWLYAIALNVVRDEWRKHHRVTHLNPTHPEPPDHAPGPEEISVHRLTVDDVRAALITLSDRHRSIVELRLSGLATKEIAATLGMSVPALKSAQTRAYTAIRELLNGKETS
ncbi:MAG: sigma-70 family RNA polymerase sigma factor [Thermomicrobiales bacterium]|nr:sigma-70 family RNA polymerase sigma factor [Thermomicrobiales bacterium]